MTEHSRVFAINQDVPSWDAEVVAGMVGQGVRALEPGTGFMMRVGESEAEDAVRVWRDAGLVVYSCHGPYMGEWDISQVDDDARKVAVDAHITAIRRAARIGIPVMVVHASHGMGRDQLAQREQLGLESLEIILAEAEKSGVRLALENLPNNFVGESGEWVRRIIDHFDSDFLGGCFDAGHANITPDGVIKSFDAMADKVISLHLQCNDGVRDLHVQPGYGSGPWHELCPRIDAMGYEFPFSLEVNNVWANGSFADMLREMHALFDGRILTRQVNGKATWPRCVECARLFTIEGDRAVCGCAR